DRARGDRHDQGRGSVPGDGSGGLSQEAAPGAAEGDVRPVGSRLLTHLLPRDEAARVHAVDAAGAARDDELQLELGLARRDGAAAHVALPARATPTPRVQRVVTG